jgi:hypothetical protein
MANLSQTNGGVPKKIDQNYQSLNLNRANRQSIPMFDPNYYQIPKNLPKMFELELG